MRPPTSSLSSGPRIALIGSGVAALVALRTASRVAAARRSGRAWRGLDHDAVIHGSEPVLRLAVLGDSAAAGHGLSDAALALPRQIGARLGSRTGRRVEIRGLAASGADTAEVADEQVGHLDVADVVVVGVGVNDALSPGRRVGEVRADTARLLAAIRAHAPDADIVLMTCPDLGNAPGLPRALAPAVRWRCRTVAVAQTRAAALAGVAVVAPPGSLSADVFGDDGFHPSAASVARLAERTVEVLLGPPAGDGDGRPR